MRIKWFGIDPRSRRITALLMTVFAPEVVFGAMLVTAGVNLGAFIRDAESLGMSMFCLIVIHIFQTPLVCSLWFYHRALTRRQADVAQGAFWLALIVAVATAFLMFRFAPFGGFSVRILGPLYLASKAGVRSTPYRLTPM